MAYQTSYNIAPAAGFRGLPLDMSVSTKRSVRWNNGAPGVFGTFVKEGGASGAVEDDVRALSAIADKPAGVLMHTHDIRQDPTVAALSAGQDMPDLSVVPLMEKGKIYVAIDTTMNPAIGDPVHVRAIANGAGQSVIGACRNAADGVNTFLLKGAKFIKGATGTSGFGAIEFDINAALT